MGTSGGAVELQHDLTTCHDCMSRYTLKGRKNSMSQERDFTFLELLNVHRPTLCLGNTSGIASDSISRVFTVRLCGADVRNALRSQRQLVLPIHLPPRSDLRGWPFLPLFY